jgi:hypothetical protein
MEVVIISKGRWERELLIKLIGKKEIIKFENEIVISEIVFLEWSMDDDHSMKDSNSSEIFSYHLI